LSNQTQNFSQPRQIRGRAKEAKEWLLLQRQQIPTLPVRKFIPVMVIFVSLIPDATREKKSHAETVTVSTVRTRSPSEEVKLKIKGEAYKFGLKSHPPMSVAGKSSCSQRIRTIHKERIQLLSLSTYDLIS